MAEDRVRDSEIHKSQRGEVSIDSQLTQLTKRVDEYISTARRKAEFSLRWLSLFSTVALEKIAVLVDGPISSSPSRHVVVRSGLLFLHSVHHADHPRCDVLRFVLHTGKS